MARSFANVQRFAVAEIFTMKQAVLVDKPFNNTVKLALLISEFTVYLTGKI